MQQGRQYSNAERVQEKYLKTHQKQIELHRAINTSIPNLTTATAMTSIQLTTSNCSPYTSQSIKLNLKQANLISTRQKRVTFPACVLFLFYLLATEHDKDHMHNDHANQVYAQQIVRHNARI